MDITDKILETARKINQMENEICLEFMNIAGIDETIPLHMIPYILVDGGYNIEKEHYDDINEYYTIYRLMKNDEEIAKQTLVVRFITDIKKF